MRKLLLLSIGLLSCHLMMAQKKGSKDAEKSAIEKASYSSLKFRSVGPALTSGRIADIAVNPNNNSEYYVASASGGVWKTTNHGVTFSPIFDSQGSYSIGCVTLDPNNSNVVWVGTGENNNQRSVAYGDGVYRSNDGGRSWKKMGFENSEHIGMIKVDPNNSDVVYVAAYGPLWSAGGERGLYKSLDGGKNWNKILDISEHTGVNEVHLDPRNSNIIYATAHQRRRHVWTYISGGPESAIYKSEDGGKTFDKLNNGIPGGDKGRIALSISPVNPDVVYAMIEGHGFYRSNNRGASWDFLNKYETSGNYYVEIYAHPTELNTVYSMDTRGHISVDGGKTWKRIPEKGKHVDNHCMWINPNNTDQMIWGCDGGLYETWDNMANWHFKDNLPVTQFYRVAVDNSKPFYNIYGGTQDNFSLGGPSRTLNARGIVNSDWFVTNTGDGFESQIDPVDPNIVYAQAQYGWLVRFDKKSGEAASIKPQPNVGEPAYRWNWDAPLIISHHDHKTLYFAANKLFKSTDRGNTWSTISDDLSRQIDRNTLPVMGKVWSMDAVSKNRSTTIYGNIVALNESPLAKGKLYVGTDDGQIHISENDGAEWKTINSFDGIPERTYVNDLKASLHDANTVYAVFNNHKSGDFKPYILKSTDNGKSWKSVAGNLPERGSVYSLAEDHVNPNLLFAGTEFGVFFTVDGGEKWMPLKGGLPTVAIRDIDIQRRENDLVLASFGRGFYVLDDYSPLRELSNDLLKKDAHIFTIKDGLVFMQASPLGYAPPGFLGASYYMGKNPEIGVTFTYYIQKEVQTKKAKRQEAEKDQANNAYPTMDQIRAEDLEEKPYLMFVISTTKGTEVRRITKDYSKGISRFTWDGRLTNTSSINSSNDPVTNNGSGMFAPEGDYQISIYKFENGLMSLLHKPETFHLTHLGLGTFKAEDQEALIAFQKEILEVNKNFSALNAKFNILKKDILVLKSAIRNTPGTDLEKLVDLRELELRLADLGVVLNGDNSLKKREFETPPSLNDRMGMTVWTSWYSTNATTGSQKRELEIVTAQLPKLTAELVAIEVEMEAVKKYLYDMGGPYLKGDIPE